MSEKSIKNQTDNNVIKKEGKILSRVRYLTMTGLMASLITIMTAYICHIPVGVNGGYIHFGDSLIYLAAVLLPRPYALIAASIGGGLADILTAPMWAPATIIIKITTFFFYNYALLYKIGYHICTIIYLYFA